jgi:hypothetical protein
MRTKEKQDLARYLAQVRARYATSPTWQAALQEAYEEGYAEGFLLGRIEAYLTRLKEPLIPEEQLLAMGIAGLTRLADELQQRVLRSLP